MDLLSGLLLLPVATGTVYHLAAWQMTRRFYGRDHGWRDREWAPVSILKPVTRREAESRENFESFCRLDYPNYEIIFALQTPDPDLIALVADLSRAYPHVNIRWVNSTENRGPNYKVGNLVAAEQAARHDLLAICDADIRVAPDWLRRIASEFEPPDVGLVTCLYRHVRFQSLPGALQALTVQTLFVPSVLVARQLEGLGYGFGATLFTSRTVLRQIGGLTTLRPYLADDFHLGRLVREGGWKVRLSRSLPDHVSEGGGLRDHLRHQLRWAITQRVSRPGGTFAAGITHLTTWAALLALASGFVPWTLGVLAFSAALRIGTSADLNRSLFKNRDLYGRLWIVPLNDLIHTAIWGLSFLSSTIRWQGRRFRVLRGGQMQELSSSMRGDHPRETAAEQGLRPNRR